MKILYVTRQSPWPLSSGARIRSRHVIDALSRKHEVVIALANTSRAEIADFMEEEGSDWSRRLADGSQRVSFSRAIGGLFSRRRAPFRTKYRNKFNDDLLRWVNDVRPDMIWYFQAPAFWQAGSAGGIATVYDMDDVESVKRLRQMQQQSFLQRVTGMLGIASFRRAERTLMDSADLVMVSNPDDEMSVRSLTGTPVLHLPNGFDFRSRLPVAQRCSNRIIFYGEMRYRPNGQGVLWFCDRVWPRIRRTAPDAVLDVVGNYAPNVERIRALPGVNLHGYISSLDKLIDESAMLVVPLHAGSGTRIKILEAWAKGLPVVSTSIGCEGLGAVDGETILIADSPELFAEHCLRLLADTELGAHLASKAHGYATDRFDWTVVHESVEQAADLAARKCR